MFRYFKKLGASRRGSLQETAQDTAQKILREFKKEMTGKFVKCEGSACTNKKYYYVDEDEAAISECDSSSFVPSYEDIDI